MHLIGDLHQPFHALGVGRGGNDVKVRVFGQADCGSDPARPNPCNLHSVWDNSLVDFQQYSYTEYARVLDIAADEEVKAWQHSSLEDWFYDSYTLANRVYASVPGDGKLGYKYNYIFQNDLDRQLLKGGVRLAELINKALQ